MTNSLASEKSSRHLQCEACDQLIVSRSLAKEAEEYVACGSSSCKDIMSKKAGLLPLFFTLYLTFQRVLIRQRRKVNRSRKHYIDNVVAREERENNNILAASLKDNARLSIENIHVVMIPTGTSKMTILSDVRVQNYRDYLECVINSANEYASASEVVSDDYRHAYKTMQLADQLFADNPELHLVSDKLCALCQGGCCTAGEDHAFLSVFGIRRYMDENQSASKQQILAMYLHYLPLEVMEEGCINQAETGCSLPRALRSDVCNGYYCDSLKAYQGEEQGSMSLKTVLAVQRSYSLWQRFDPNVSNDVIHSALIESEARS